MAKRDVWVRVGDELVRGDTITAITVEASPSYYRPYRLLLKAAGYRDQLEIVTGIVALGDGTDKDDCHQRATALADDFVNTLARAAARPTGALIRLTPADGDDEDAAWELTALG